MQRLHSFKIPSATILVINITKLHFYALCAQRALSSNFCLAYLLNYVGNKVQIIEPVTTIVTFRLIAFLKEYISLLDHIEKKKWTYKPSLQ